MKRGFTLIEMLVVIVIISMLSIIVFPLIMNQFAEKKDSISDITKKMIVDAAELYARERNINYGSISLKDLVDDGKLEEPIKDYKTGKTIPLSLKIYIDINMNACLEGESGCIETRKPTEYVGVEKKKYNEGAKLRYAGLDWKVIKDYGHRVTIILSENYTTGTYGTDNGFKSGNNAYEKLNNDFIKGNTIIQNDIKKKGIIRDISSNSYVRLPKEEELSTKISNDSKTNFWTMSKSGANLYYGLPNGTKTYTQYDYGNKETFYYGFGESGSDVKTKTIDTSGGTTSRTAITSPTSVTATSSYSPYYVDVGYGSSSVETFVSNYKIDVSGKKMFEEYDATDGSGNCVYSGKIANFTKCEYTCSKTGAGQPRTITDNGGSSSVQYCDTGGFSKGTVNYPAVSFTATGTFYVSLTTTKNSTFTGNNIYSASSYTCPSAPSSASSNHAHTYWICTSGCSKQVSGTYYYYASSEKCSKKKDYYTGEKTTYMGIRPVITVKKK